MKTNYSIRIFILINIFFVNNLLSNEIEDVISINNCQETSTRNIDSISNVSFTDTSTIKNKNIKESEVLIHKTVKYPTKIYETFVYLNNQKSIVKGILYEIKDSTLLIANSVSKTNYLTGNFQTSNIDIKNIQVLSLRRTNNIKRNAFIWGGIGLAAPLILLFTSGESSQDPLIQFVAYTSAPILSLVGAGAGALLGSMRINIPIDGKYENFKENELRLKKYSIVQEQYGGENSFEKMHRYKWCVNINLGASIPLKGFDAGNKGSINANHPKIGGNNNIMIGYNFTNNFGLSAESMMNSYNIKDSSTEWWNLMCFLIGPYYSLALNNKLILDLRMMIGSTSAYYGTGDYNNEMIEIGTSYNPNLLLKYSFSRRWCAIAEAGYLYSNLKSTVNDLKNNIHVVNFGVGIGYRFD